MKKIKIQELMTEYYASLDYRSLSDSAKRDYKYCLNTLLATVVRDRSISKMYLQSMNTPNSSELHTTNGQRGVFHLLTTLML
jgi:hypothetical protein